MKKLSIFLLALVGVLALASCDNNNNEKTPTPDETPTVTPTPSVDRDAKLANPDSSIGYFAVGGHADDWAITETNGMTAVSLNELEAISPALATKAEEKNAYVYVMKDYLLTNDGAWTTPAGADAEGNAILADGGMTIKVIRGKFDAEDDVWSNDQWISDPKTAHAESLTPETLFLPNWVEEAEAGKEAYGTWSNNPVCIGVTGKYTVVIMDYHSVSSADQAGFGLALILTEEVKPEPTEEEKMVAEFNALKEAGVSGTEGTTEYTFEGTVVAATSVLNDKYGTYNVRAVVELPGGTLVYLHDCQYMVDGAYGFPKVTKEYKEGDKIQFVGKVQYYVNGDVIGGSVGDAAAEIEFKKPQVIEDTYATVTVKSDKAINVYWWGAKADNPAWPGVAMTDNGDGTYSAQVPEAASNLIFNWTGGQTVSLDHNPETPCWTLGDAKGGDGDDKEQLTATAAKCYYDDVTVEGLKEALAAIAAGLETPVEIPEDAEYYVWFWGGSATGWFEKVDITTGSFKVGAGSTGCTFIAVTKGTEPGWDAKLAQTGDYNIASGVAAPKASA